MYWVYERNKVGDWEVAGVYSEQKDASSHALSVMLLYGDVMIKTKRAEELPEMR